MASSSILASVKWFLAGGATAIVALSQGGPAAAQSFGFAPPPQAAIKAQLKLWGTRYWVHAANASTAPRAVGLRKPNGSLHGVSLTAEDFCHAALEGTVRVTLPSGTAQVFNYAARGNRTFVDCAPRFPSLKPSVRAALGKTLFTAVPADAPFGLGVANFRLVPYRTVAVDRTKIAYGTLLYIPALRGRTVLLPSGASAAHDGYVFAADTGGAIKNDHVDIFTGVSSQSFAPQVFASSPHVKFDAFVVDEPNALAEMRRLHLRS